MKKNIVEILTLTLALAVGSGMPVFAETGTSKTSIVESKADELTSGEEENENEDSESKDTTNSSWDGDVLTASAGVVYGPTGKETYYNLDMSGVIQIMRDLGNTDEYWVRSDGVKMLGDYVMVAANLEVFPRGTLVECSLGTAIVCDTGSFAAANPYQLDIAVTW